MSEREVLRTLPNDPPCPRCGRRYPVKTMKPAAKKATLYCDPDRAIGGCGTEYSA